MTCLEKATTIKDEIVAHRRYLHENAEIGFDVTKTTDYIYKTLQGYGYQPKKLKKGGVVAEIKAKDGGRDGFILLRADIDGLKMQEESGEKFACSCGNMHACGHDFHTASLLSAAKLIAQEKQLTTSVRLLFQPAEEILQGGKYAIDNGVCDKVKKAFSLHVLSGINLPVGQVVFSPAGAVAPSADTFEIRITGKSSHGAMPYDGVDVLPPTAAILHALTGVVAQEIPIGEGLLTVGVVKTGESANVIADKGIIKGSLRTFDEKIRRYIKQRIRQIIKGVCTAYRTTGEVQFFGGCPSLWQDEKVLFEYQNQLKKEIGMDKIFVPDNTQRKMGASEDFAYISREVPSVLVSVSASQKGGGYPLHHPRVVFDEGALPVCTACYLAFAKMG